MDAQVSSDLRDRPPDSNTSRTPRSNNSSGYFLGRGMNTEFLSRGPNPRFKVSVKPGLAHPNGPLRPTRGDILSPCGARLLHRACPRNARADTDGIPVLLLSRNGNAEAGATPNLSGPPLPTTAPAAPPRVLRPRHPRGRRSAAMRRVRRPAPHPRWPGPGCAQGRLKRPCGPLLIAISRRQPPSGRRLTVPSGERHPGLSAATNRVAAVVRRVARPRRGAGGV